MVETGFNSTFIGIETPEEKSLHACNKVQNKNRDLLESVKKIQNAGMQVSGGFIVGFDSDTPIRFSTSNRLYTAKRDRFGHGWPIKCT